MMPRAVLAVLAALVVLAGADAGSAVADEAGNANPIRRVVTLLQNMAKKISAEGEKEEDLFEKYQCFCRNAGGDLQTSISESTAKVPEVQSSIEASESNVKQLQLDLKSHQEDRVAAKSAMQAATAQREGEHKQFLATSGEYKSYVAALDGAIPAIENGMAGGFLQTQTGARVRQAIINDDTVTDYDRQLAMSFLSGGAADNSGYVPKAGDIVGILKQIHDDFSKSLADVTSEEESAAKLFGELMAAKTKQVNTLTSSIESKTERVGRLQVDIVNMKNDLTETEAALIADKDFLANLDTNCETKTAEYEERKKTRSEELVAVHETIKILNDDDALELFKKTLPSPSLLQLQAGEDQMRQKALALIRGVRGTSRSGRPELDLMALVLSGKKVDFSKVLKMIDDMVALLGQEQADDENKREYCQLQIDSTEDKAKELDKNIEDLETLIAETEEAISTLSGEIKQLVAGVAALDKSVAEATEQRKNEHDEVTDLLSSNNAAKELLGFAKNRLNKFYNPALYAAPPKPEEETSFVQISRHMQRGRDAPPPAPETGTYSPKSGQSTGVISMIDQLIADLDKEITEAETDEKQSQKEYEEIMSDSATKRAADLKAMAAKEKAKADAEESHATASESSKVETKELQATKMYEMQLHGECDWLMQNFDLRKQARGEEVESLKSAKAVLAGADFSLVQGKAAGKTGSQVAGRRLRGQ